jgi:putative aldouronate transport system permease protein
VWSPDGRYIYFSSDRGPAAGFATAAGLFKGIVAAILIFTADRISKSVGESGLL